MKISTRFFRASSCSLFFSLCSISMPAINRSKTFFTSRPVATMIPLESDLSLHDVVNRAQRHSILEDEEVDIALYFTPFVSFSHNQGDLARYFLFEGARSLKIGGSGDIDHQYLKFNETTNTNLAGTIELAPDTVTSGVRFDYFINLHHFVKYLSMRVVIPFVHTCTRPHLHISESTVSTVASKTIANYFSGQPMMQQAETIDSFEKNLRDLQSPLSSGKIAHGHDKTGIADVHFRMSYDPVHNERWHVRLNGFLIIPTTAGSRSEWLFEPRIGTGGHWALGLGAQWERILWQEKNTNPSEHQAVALLFDARYHYLFENHEVRILGLKDRDGNNLNFGHYLLLGQTNQSLVLPAANILAQNVRVRPGSQFESMVALSYRHGRNVIRGGLDSWYRQRESIKRRDDWDDTRFGFPGKEFATKITKFSSDSESERNDSRFALKYSNLTNVIDALKDAGATAAEQGMVLSSQVNVDAARSQRAFSNMIFGSWDYLWESAHVVAFVGLGLAYEFPFDNAALRATHVWLKGGVLF